MKTEIIHSLTKNFESFAHKTNDGLEFWFARDLQKLLGYSKWENFINAIKKAKLACETFGEESQHHFPDVRKTIPVPNGGNKEMDDIMLTRYACYLIAQNGDPSKDEIAFAQTYFAIQTRKVEGEKNKEVKSIREKK